MILLKNPLFRKIRDDENDNRAEKVGYGAFVSEKFWHQFWQKTFSAESGHNVFGICFDM